ncbi:MAG TPA: hypothetical protein PLP01_01785 [Phycisphaerae bacterium]|nr:hypothetical protein [Phycisphaerae bacterium]
MTHSQVRRLALSGPAAVAAVALAGCTARLGGERLVNPFPQIRTFVVAPVMNLSTTARLDMIEVANALSSELQQVEGVTVVPIGRVYEYLASQQMATVGSPEEARALAQVFKADAVIVAAVTEYDPFVPPRMGLAVQVYTSSPLGPEGGATFDPVESSRAAVPFPLGDEAASRPLDMVSRVFSGAETDVENLARVYARERQSDASPYGWRRFVVNQHDFQRLCSYAVIRELLGAEGRKMRWPHIKIGPEATKWPK